MNKIDRIIDINLKLIFETSDHSLFTGEMIDPDLDYSLSGHEAGVLANYLVTEDLITLNVEVCNITNRGLEISELGGWKIYKDLQSKKLLEESVIANDRSKLEEENLKSSIENQNYEISNRENKREIDQLTKENLKLSNLNLYFTIGGFIAGVLLTFIF